MIEVIKGWGGLKGQQGAQQKVVHLGVRRLHPGERGVLLLARDLGI